MGELGFGTGLNFLVTLEAWQAAACPGRLRYLSLERYPMEPTDRARALAPYPALAALAGPWLGALPATTGRHTVRHGAVSLVLVVADAREALPTLGTRADAWYLDGFAPARNPEMSEPALLAAVARHTAPGGTCATFTAAGQVRRDLAAAGFVVQRVPGYGAKRHMTRGTLPAPR